MVRRSSGALALVQDWFLGDRLRVTVSVKILNADNQRDPVSLLKVQPRKIVEIHTGIYLLILSRTEHE